MTEIEKAAFVDSSAHRVSAFLLQGEALSIRIHPSQNPNTIVRLHFNHIADLHIDASYNEGDFALPWDIFGFEPRSLPDDSYEFILHCDTAEFSFRARWPAIERLEATKRD